MSHGPCALRLHRFSYKSSGKLICTHTSKTEMRSVKIFLNLLLLGFCRSINYEDQPVEDWKLKPITLFFRLQVYWEHYRNEELLRTWSWAHGWTSIWHRTSITTGISLSKTPDICGICLLMNFKYNPASVRRLFHEAFQLNILRKTYCSTSTAEFHTRGTSQRTYSNTIFTRGSIYSVFIRLFPRCNWVEIQVNFLKKVRKRELDKLKCYTNLAKKDRAIIIRHTRGNWLKEQTGSQELNKQLSSQKSEPVKRGL